MPNSAMFAWRSLQLALFLSLAECVWHGHVTLAATPASICQAHSHWYVMCVCVCIYMLRHTHTHTLIICKQYAWPKLQLLVSFRFVSSETKNDFAIFRVCCCAALQMHICRCCSCYCCVCVSATATAPPAGELFLYFLCVFYALLLRLLMNYAVTALPLHHAAQLRPVSLYLCRSFIVSVFVCVCVCVARFCFYSKQHPHCSLPASFSLRLSAP